MKTSRAGALSFAIQIKKFQPFPIMPVLASVHHSPPSMKSRQAVHLEQCTAGAIDVFDHIRKRACVTVLIAT
jgi:hypothetical protein